MRPFVVDVDVECTVAFVFGTWMEVSGVAFRRNVSRSRKWLENDESKNGR